MNTTIKNIINLIKNTSKFELQNVYLSNEFHIKENSKKNKLWMHILNDEYSKISNNYYKELKSIEEEILNFKIIFPNEKVFRSDFFSTRAKIYHNLSKIILSKAIENESIKNTFNEIFRICANHELIHEEIIAIELYIDFFRNKKIYSLKIKQIQNRLEENYKKLQYNQDLVKLKQIVEILNTKNISYYKKEVEQLILKIENSIDQDFPIQYIVNFILFKVNFYDISKKTNLSTDKEIINNIKNIKARNPEKLINANLLRIIHLELHLKIRSGIFEGCMNLIETLNLHNSISLVNKQIGYNNIFLIHFLTGDYNEAKSCIQKLKKAIKLQKSHAHYMRWEYYEICILFSENIYEILEKKLNKLIALRREEPMIRYEAMYLKAMYLIQIWDIANLKVLIKQISIAYTKLKLKEYKRYKLRLEILKEISVLPSKSDISLYNQKWISQLSDLELLPKYDEYEIIPFEKIIVEL